MVTSPLRFMAILAGSCGLLLASCGHNTVVLSPSLAPIDVSRQIVRYQPIQGTSCKSMLEAIWDMKRLVGVDGYLEVSIQHSSCWTATAYPFTYGTEPKSISVRSRSSMPVAAKGATVPAAAGAEPVHTAAAPPPPPPPPTSRRRNRSRSARASAPAPPPPPPAPVARTMTRSSCEPACRAFGKHAGATALIQRVVADRCISRCVSGDVAYFDCVRDTRDVTDVKRCNSK